MEDSSSSVLDDVAMESRLDRPPTGLAVQPPWICEIAADWMYNIRQVSRQHMSLPILPSRTELPGTLNWSHRQRPRTVGADQ